MKLLLIASFLWISCSSLHEPLKNSEFNSTLNQSTKWIPTLAIMQGPTSEAKTQFIIQHQSSVKIKSFLVDRVLNKKIDPSSDFIYAKKNSLWSLSHVQFKNLSPIEDGVLVITNESGDVLDFRNFKTIHFEKKQIKFVVVSCMRDDLKPLKPIWNALMSHKPNALFFIGDNVYIDHNLKAKIKSVEPDDIWQRHSETRNLLPIFRIKDLIPIYSTWDDHDFGKGNGGLSFKYKEESLDIFKSFFSLKNNDDFIQSGVALSYSVNIADQQFLFLDNRSFRTTSDNQKPQQHFGMEQEKWLIAKAKNFNGPTWLISGDQFFGGYHQFESFEGNHPENFKDFIERLKGIQSKIYFLSGDRHFSEVMKIPKNVLGYETYEFTSSPVHSTIYNNSLKRFNNPKRQKGVDGVWNFMLFEILNRKGKRVLNIKDFDQKNKILFEETLMMGKLKDQ